MDLNEFLWDIEITPNVSTDTLYLVPDRYELYPEQSVSQFTTREFFLQKKKSSGLKGGIHVEISEYRGEGVLDIIGGEVWEASLLLCVIILQNPIPFLSSSVSIKDVLINTVYLILISTDNYRQY